MATITYHKYVSENFFSFLWHEVEKGQGAHRMQPPPSPDPYLEYNVM